MVQDLNAVFYSDSYHPIQAGSIDGTDTAPHDNAVYRAMLATGLYDPLGDPKAQGDPYCTVFVGRLSKDTTEETLKKAMSQYGQIKSLRLVRHIVTGASQGYAFVEYETEKDMRYAYESAHRTRIDGMEILVDYNRQILMPGWIPRRLGGGLGGRKESGQLRFGGRDRPFRKPLRPIPEKELEKLGIPLPGNYMHRFEIPPLPRRKQDKGLPDELVPRSSMKESIHEDNERRQHGRRHERRQSYYDEEKFQEYGEYRQHRRRQEFDDGNTKRLRRGDAKTSSEFDDGFRSYQQGEHDKRLETITEEHRKQHRRYDLKVDEREHHERCEKDLEEHEKDYCGDVERHERSHKRHHSKQGSNEKEHSERYERDNLREDGKKRHRREYDHEAGNAKALKDRRAEKDFSDRKDKGHHHRKHEKTVVEDGKKDKHQKKHERTCNGKEHDETRGHKRGHSSRSERTPDTGSSQTDKRSKSRRYESRETSIDDRWNP